MTLLVGSKLGPYEILGPLGSGGMGEVYRARDPRLHRQLAIKVLPASIARDPERLARFQSEARAASALSHPNIITIHGIGSEDGLAYILMELVDGKTVRQVLDGGPPPLKKTLLIAVQAAAGLAAAHAAGIVHRDLKPENLMVSRDGVVKILDFGLAKTTPLYARPGEETATYQGADTRAGSVLGTVGYMSPEQAAGRSLDFRSDQFSFGTILHELLTGKRTWKRDSAAETLTAIIREDPQPPIAAGAPSVPTALRWIVDRCLAKDPEERYASTQDLVRDLITLRDHLSEAGTADLRVGAHGPSKPASRRRRTIIVAALVALALGAAIALAPRLRNRPLSNWTQVGFGRGIVWSGRFAPDGQTIVYSASWDGQPPRLFSTRPAWTETRTLDLPSGALLAISRTNELAFVRNANFAKFFTQPGTLVSAGLEGGIGRDLLDDVQAADWSPDGAQLAVAREVNGRVRLQYPIGKTLYETPRPISNVRLSRDGRWIAFLEGGSEVSLSVLRISDRTKRTLSTGWFPSAVGLAWSADGREIWFTPQKQVRDSSPPLLAVSLSGKLREVFRGPGQMHLFDIAPDGRVLLARWDVQVGVRGFAPSAQRDRELSATDDSLLSDLSSDGTAVLFQDRDALFLRRTDGSPPVRLGQRFREARLSPDGKWALALPPEEPSHPVLVPIGAGEVRRIETQLCDGAEWFPDGKRILCERQNPAGIIALTAIELPSGKATPIPISVSASQLDRLGTISPDGESLAGTDRVGNVWILPLTGGKLQRFGNAASFGRGVFPAGWAADGQHIFIHHAGEIPDRVERLDLSTGRVEPWSEITLEDLAGVVRISPVRVAANGRSWAYSYLRVLSNLYIVEGLK